MTSDTTLTLLLAGPLQSWGEDSRHMTRNTLTHPSKSGVTGLVAAALGFGRGDARISELAALRFGVRVDQPGRLLIDYHTVSAASRNPLDVTKQRMPTAEGGTLKLVESTKVTRRHYLADARFVTAFQGNPDLLATVWEALARPRYPLFLGRRSCPPASRVRLRLWEATEIEDAFSVTPWAAGSHVTSRQSGSEVSLRTIIDDPAGGEAFHDFPLPSPPHRLRFGTRTAHHGVVTVPVPGIGTNDNKNGGPAVPARHDPFELLPE